MNLDPCPDCSGFIIAGKCSSSLLNTVEGTATLMRCGVPAPEWTPDILDSCAALIREIVQGEAIQLPK